MTEPTVTAEQIREAFAAGERDRQAILNPRAPALLCGECEVIHRPGENTMCPGWRPAPEMDLAWVAQALCALARKHGCVLRHYDLRREVTK